MVVVRKKYAADRLEMERHWDIAGDGRCAKGKEEGRPELARTQSMNQPGRKNPLESGEASKLPHCERLAIGANSCIRLYLSTLRVEIYFKRKTPSTPCL